MFLTEIGKCDFLTEMYYYKNNKSRSLCQANTNKKESQISLELFQRCVWDFNICLYIKILYHFLKPVAHSGSALNLFQFLLEVVC